MQSPCLNLFDVPSTDYSLVESRYVPINPFKTGIHPIDFQIDRVESRFVPINPFTTSIHPIDFQIDPQDDFIDMSNSYLEAELQLKLDNGSNVVDATQVTVCNNFIHSLFKQINVRLNGTLISPQTDT